jgi:hypothetical protein
VVLAVVVVQYRRVLGVALQVVQELLFSSILIHEQLLLVLV